MLSAFLENYAGLIASRVFLGLTESGTLVRSTRSPSPQPLSSPPIVKGGPHLRDVKSVFSSLPLPVICLLNATRTAPVLPQARACTPGRDILRDWPEYSWSV